MRRQTRHNHKFFSLFCDICIKNNVDNNVLNVEDNILNIENIRTLSVKSIRISECQNYSYCKY